MTRYRACTVGSDGHFVHCRVFACDTDEHAVEWAKQLMAGRAVELWSGAQLVKRLAPPDDRRAITCEIDEGRLVQESFS
jgi:hypothetical protein